MFYLNSKKYIQQYKIKACIFLYNSELTKFLNDFKNEFNNERFLNIEVKK